MLLLLLLEFLLLLLLLPAAADKLRRVPASSAKPRWANLSLNESCCRAGRPSLKDGLMLLLMLLLLFMLMSFSLPLLLPNCFVSLPALILRSHLHWMPGGPSSVMINRVVLQIA